MELDLRLTTLERLDEVLGLPATTISVGHEGCPHKLPALDDLRRAADRVRRGGKSFTFVAPISFERFAPAVVHRIAGLIADGPITVVANDIGLLATLAERRWSTSSAIAVGHGLSYTYEQQPWIDLALSREDASVRDPFYRNSLDDPYTLAQLREWGVAMVEVDDLPRARRHYGSLRDTGFALNVLLDVVPIAYARSCHTARHYNTPPGDCTRLCDRPFQIAMTHRWRLYHDQLEPMARATRATVPDFTVYGNVVYRRVDDGGAEPVERSEVQRATLDVRFYAPDSLRSRVAALIGGS